MRSVSPLEPGPSPLLQPGTLLEGKWSIQSLLGKGGMGAVYVALDLALSREVAIKVLAAELSSDREFISRFRKEAQLQARLDHPHIAPLYAVGEHQGRPFFVMKRLFGQPLSAHLQEARPPCPPAQVLGWVRELCSALEAVHAAGLVHRDIKPSNLWLDLDGRLTLLDFGICHDDNAPTSSNIRLGSPAYMSPDQLHGAKVTAASDLYSVGVLCFHLLTGMLPFHAESDIALAHQHVYTPPPDARETSPHVGPAVAALLMRMLAKAPLQRPASAQALVQELEAAFATDAAYPQGRKPPARYRWPLWAGTSLSLAVVALLAWNFKPSRAESLPPPPLLASAPPAQEAPVAPPVPATAPAAVLTRSSVTRKAARVSSVGELRIMTLHQGEPTWGALFVNGEARGNAPARLSLRTGEHHVRIVRAGFTTWEGNVRVLAGKVVPLRIQLTASAGPKP